MASRDGLGSLCCAATFISIVVAVIFISVSKETECSFLGISKGLYSIFGHFDCDGFHARDLITVIIWIIATWTTLIKLFDLDEEYTAGVVLGYWLIFMVFAVFLEFGLALGIILAITCVLLPVKKADTGSTANNEVNPQPSMPRIQLP